MTDWTVDSAATALLEAEDARASRAPITGEWPSLDLATAYAVQDETLRRRLARGERLAGLKLGTSRAKQQRMGISTPLTAWLTDAMVLPAGAAVPLAAAGPDRVPEPGLVPDVDRAHLNMHGAGPQRGERAVRTADDLRDGGRVRDDGQEHVGLGGDLRSRPGHGAARGGQVGRAAPPVAGHLETAFQEVAGDRESHLAEADQSDSVHRRLLAVCCPVIASRRPRCPARAGSRCCPR